ncbi:HAMP domain-containing protein [Chitinophaga pendula]|uniref:sensor histidine kinase n=1 Tax=Chitinophaga TaxID=79328 RepID=UPI000BB09847|nr:MULTISPECIES: ATP-binding protein [Chitinophaga]ASZ10220.1 PAS domain-containing sensor histidine kinase [Chitinophaga sp. MD30]UCJ06821.1 HAMP domain-containing protein [Chitinophaga pendula]
MSTFRLKTKITMGVLFLFAMLLLVSILGYYYLNKLNREARIILEDNYESLEYSKNMLAALDQLPVSRQEALQAIGKNLQKQEENVTELGESQATGKVRVAYQRLLQDSTYSPAILRQSIYVIMDLNMQAIVGKNETVKRSADKALLWIAIISGVCFLLGFTFVFNFPGYIANPIRELTEGIKGIAERKYTQRLYFKSADEFGELAQAFNTMAQQLDEYEHSNLARIMFEKKRAEAVISSLRDATIGLDNKDTILFANQPALQLLNMPEKDLVGFPASKVAKQNDLLNYLVNRQDNNPLKIVVDGKECFFTKEMVNIQHEQGNIGYVIILKNITTFKEQDLAKTHFIATISHELKTPLASSDFSLKLLEDERIGQLSGEQHELVESLKQDNLRMIKIVSELLNLSQVESGNIQLQPQPVLPGSIVHYALETVQKQAAQRDINIVTQVPEQLPKIQADVEKTAWVLINLLTNAIRYSAAHAAIVLDVSQHDPQTLTFSVKDEGKGIPAAFKDKIFQRFYQVPGTQHKAGSGLGLAISREFIEAQGGTIGVESEEGKGSLFYFRLPVA